MKGSCFHAFWHAGALLSLDCTALALLTFAGFRLGVPEPAMGLLYLLAVVLISLQGRFVLALLSSMVAFLYLDYFFVPPVFTFVVAQPADIVVLFTFLAAALIATTLVARLRNSQAEVRKQAQLLALAHDAIIVRDAQSQITFWNPGAERIYGWTAKEAIGRVSHELLQTQFPDSQRAVEVALQERGEWEGELTHVTRQGTAIVVASRQSLGRGRHGTVETILEMNRDITEHKRAQQAWQKAQTELAHVARVATLGE